MITVCLQIQGLPETHLSSRVLTIGFYTYTHQVNKLFEVQTCLCATFILWVEKAKACNINEDNFPASRCLQPALLVFIPNSILMRCFPGTPAKDLVSGEESDFYQLGCFQVLNSYRRMNMSESPAHADLLHLTGTRGRHAAFLRSEVTRASPCFSSHAFSAS